MVAVKGVVSRKIEKCLDSYLNEMDKYWKSGAMKKGLMRNNPNLKSKFIIEPNNLSREESPQVNLKKNNMTASCIDQSNHEQASRLDSNKPSLISQASESKQE